MALINKPSKRKLKSKLKQNQQTAVELSQQADQQIEKLLLRRVERLISVKRFVFLWTALFILIFLVGVIQIRSLSAQYQTPQPAAGGFFSEGLVGNFTNANPIYATNTADAAVSKLVFSSLLKIDNNDKLVGDLASSWQRQKDNRTYIVKLKPGAVWQDGQPVTADDVVFTYRTIQKPEAQSPLRSSWSGITVTKLNGHTVSFNLPDPLTAFPYSLVNGILPAHILNKTPANQLRSSDFNTRPVGSGPFGWRFVEVTGQGTPERQQRITLAANRHYYDGSPKLDGFSLTTFTDDNHLIAAYDKKQVYAISGLDSLPDNLKKGGVTQFVIPYDSIVMAFMNNSNGLLNDVKVRQALVRAVDQRPLISLTGVPVNLAKGPLLDSQFNAASSQNQATFNAAAARKLLETAGWRKGKDGLRHKGGQTLALALRTQDSRNYAATAQYLQASWNAIGVKADIRYYDSNDLQSVIIANHDYDILLYGISNGLDPDVFAYWDSSQASISSAGHLNLSEYKNKLADQALEAGRTRPSLSLRKIKYQNFLKVWRADAPALALYQPNYLYFTHGPLFNFMRHSIVSSTDRFNNVQNWEIRQTRQTL